jgi:hypothetical protein
MDNASILRAALAAVPERQIAAQFRKTDRPASTRESGAQRKQLLRIPGVHTPHARVARGRPR